MKFLKTRIYLELHTQVNKVGKLPERANERIRQTLYNLIGKRIVITIEKEKKFRSNQQNRWLWGIAYKALSDLTGYKSDEIHEFCKQKFLQPKEIMIGEDKHDICSTRKLTTTEFMGYKADIQQWAAETLDLVIPDPNSKQQ